MDLPDSLLEQIFSYLNWKERAIAARVCRRWLSIFHSPCLWRRIVFSPPNRSFTRMQYDMEGYRISRCFRAIGYYVREYCFPKNDDIFLLNRILSLLAKFLEANPSKTLDIPVVDSDLPIFELDEESGDTPADEVLESKGASAASDLQRDETPESDYMREKLTDYLATIEGDPDAEATLNLVLKLQERELLSMSSESSDEEEDEIITAIYRRVSMSASAPKPSSMQGEPSRGRKYQRSQSCRYARYPEPRRPAPIVRAFSLDFHCEVDENRGIAYGTGGALLGTIRRVVRQLNRVQCLRLTDLFLAVPDARRLILDLHETASTSLMDLNLMHLHKLSGDPTVQSFESLLAERTLPDPNGDSFWYLLDPRWLGARPRHFGENPIADLATLFPCLRRLTLAPTQLSGPMLLRLLYQTCLTELCITETEFTAFTIQHGDPNRDAGHRAYDLPDDVMEIDEGVDRFRPEDHMDDELIDWSGDVPHFRDRLGSLNVSSSSLGDWRPISDVIWRAALILRPNLSVNLKFHFSHALFRDQTSDTLSADRRIAQLLALWPNCMAPVTAIIFRTINVELATHFLTLKNPFNLTIYSKTLRTLIIQLELPKPSECDNGTSSANASVDQFADFNNLLCDIVISSLRLSLIGLGGNRMYLSLVTLLTVCHQCGRRMSSSIDSEQPATHFRLLVDKRCCPFANCKLHGVSATVRAWYSMVVETSSDPTVRAVAAERCISSALMQPRWRFLTSAQFESQLSDYLK